MGARQQSSQEQKIELVQKFYREHLWQIYLSEDDFALLKDDEIFKSVAAELIALDKKRPNYISLKFYKHILWRKHISEEHIPKLDMSLEANRIIRAGELDNVMYLSNLISDHGDLEDFYSVNGNKEELLMRISSLFSYLATWRHDYKTNGRQDAAVARKMSKKLSECADLLYESADIRFNLQMHWESYLSKNGLPRKQDQYIDVLGTLRALAVYLKGIEPLAAQKKSPVKKIHAEDAAVHYAARKLKELFEKYSVPKRQHIKYINDLINAVMKENTSEDRIRKLVS